MLNLTPTGDSILHRDPRYIEDMRRLFTFGSPNSQRVLYELESKLVEANGMPSESFPIGLALHYMNETETWQNTIDALEASQRGSATRIATFVDSIRIYSRDNITIWYAIIDSTIVRTLVLLSFDFISDVPRAIPV